MKLYHTSELELPSPDVNYGRRNADFGGGFYLSDSLDFAEKWSSGRRNCVNYYTLDLNGLKVKRFTEGAEWFDYIAANRIGKEDALADFDVIIGPVANDTLYDTYGILFSGLVTSAEALKLLSVGRHYTQVNIKTEKAASQLKWEGARKLGDGEISAAKEIVKAEETEFRNAFNTALKTLENYSLIKDILF